MVSGERSQEIAHANVLWKVALLRELAAGRR